MADSQSHCPFCTGFIHIGELIHRCSDHKMHARSWSEPPLPPALNPIHDGVRYGDLQAPMQPSQSNTSSSGLIKASPDSNASGPPQTPRIPQQGFRRHRRHSGILNREEFYNFLGSLPSSSHVKNSGGDRGGEASNSPATAVNNPINVNSEKHPVFGELNRAFNRASMSLSNGAGLPNNSPGSGMFTNYMDNNPNIAGIPRSTPSPSPSHGSSQVNGGGMVGINGGMPMNAGHQMDLNHLYEMVLELSEVLKNNREMTKGIINSAEEIMVCATCSIGSCLSFNLLTFSSDSR